MDYQQWLASLNPADAALVREAAAAAPAYTNSLTARNAGSATRAMFIRSGQAAIAAKYPALRRQLQARGLLATFDSYGVKTGGLGQGAGLLMTVAAFAAAPAIINGFGGGGSVVSGAVTPVSAAPVAAAPAATAGAAATVSGTVAGGAATATATEAVLANAGATLNAVGSAVSAASTLGLLKSPGGDAAFTDYQGYSTGYDMASMPPPVEPPTNSAGTGSLAVLAMLGIPFLLFA